MPSGSGYGFSSGIREGLKPDVRHRARAVPALFPLGRAQYTEREVARRG